MSIKQVATAALTVATLTIAALPQAAGAERPEGTVIPRFSRAIPNVPGKSLVAVEVSYAPGGASAPHRHAGSAFIYAYVLSGEIESQVDDDPPRIYKAGESFDEVPGAHHRISRNASMTRPARLLAVFVVDSGDQPLTTSDR
jgi:quercetin dioxygenase-like cupin family protein